MSVTDPDPQTGTTTATFDGGKSGTVALLPGFDLDIPQGLQRFDELHAYVQAQASAHWGRSPETFELIYPELTRLPAQLHVRAYATLPPDNDLRPSGFAQIPNVETINPTGVTTAPHPAFEQSLAMRRRHWQKLLLGTALLCILIAALAAGWRYRIKEQILHQDQQSNEIQTRLQQERKQLETWQQQEQDRHQKQAELHTRLSEDLNPVFDSIEQMKLAGARLRSMNVDMNTRRVQLQYELQQLTQVNGVERSLNQLDLGIHWQLQSATQSPTIPGAAAVQAQWVGQF